MVEPAVLVRALLGEEPQRPPGAFDDLGARAPPALGGGAHPAQPESDRRDAADLAGALVRRGRPIEPRAIANDPGARVRLFPEEHEGALRQVLEEGIVGW